MSSELKYDGEFLHEVVDCVARDIEQEVMRPAARHASTRIAATASSQFMRRAGAVDGGTFGTIGPRARSDNGPLRIVTSRLVRSVLNRSFDGLRESINELRIVGRGKLLMSKGSAVPYAGVHEFGFSGSVNVPAHTRKHPTAGDVRVRAHQRSMTVKKRPYLEPAMRKERGNILDRTTAIFVDFVKACVKRAARRSGGPRS